MRYLPLLLLTLATNAHATTVTHRWYDPNIDPYLTSGMCQVVPPCGDGLFLDAPNADHATIQFEVFGEELLGFWHPVAAMEPWWYGEIDLEVPDGCHLSRMRFLGAGGYSEWSNVIATPTGCTPTEYVPEPGGLGLLAGLGVLWWMKGRGKT